MRGEKKATHSVYNIYNPVCKGTVRESKLSYWSIIHILQLPCLALHIQDKENKVNVFITYF